MTNARTRRLGRAAILAIALAGTAPALNVAGPPPAGAAPALATVYDSTDAGPPVSVRSVGYQATSVTELGDEVELAAGPRQLVSVTTVLGSYGCETGTGTACQTTPGATFTHPLTMTLYEVVDTPEGPTAGPVIAALTQEFEIPLRPSYSPQCADGDPTYATGYYSPVDEQCHVNVAVPVTFEFPGLPTLPDRVIWGLAFRTTSYGRADLGGPIGDAPCRPTCGYDSLNLGMSAADVPPVGTDPDPDGVFASMVRPQWYCDAGAGGAGTFRVDTPCWTGARPMAAITTLVPATVPGAPAGVTAVAGDGTAQLQWSAPPSDGGSPITGYTAAPTAGAGSCAVDGLTAACSGLSNDVAYTFDVRAVNDVGTGPAATSNAVTPTAMLPPTTPPPTTPPPTTPPTEPPPTTPTPPTPPPSGPEFEPAAPSRVFDTRESGPPPEGPSTYELDVADLGEVPSEDVTAVSMNVTTTGATADGYVTVYPCGPLPEVSTVNFQAGHDVANAVIATVSADGTFCIYTSEPVQLIADVTGWFGVDSAFVPSGPARLFDTRSGGDTVLAGSSLAVQVADLPGVTPPDGIGAVSLNVTVTNPEAAGYITVYPCGERGDVSSVNYGAGQTIANAVLAPVSPEGTICFYSSQTTDLLADINGFLTEPSEYAAVGPARVFDTRPGASPGALRTVSTSKVGGADVLAVQLTDLPGVVPVGARSVALNVTADAPEGDGYVTVFPCGTQPDASSLNYTAGQTVANAVIVPVADDGTVCFYSQHPTHLVVDVVGWFA